MNSKILNMLLWLAQLIMVFMFLFGFYSKILQPVETTAQMLPWVAEQPILAKITGIVDLLGALGLLLPALLRIQPKLVIYTAYGGVLLMVSAIIFHLMRGETEAIGLNFILIAILIFIIWGRTKLDTISAK